MYHYKMSTNEAVAIMVNLICNKFFLSNPRYFTELAGNAAWIMVLYIFAVTAIFWIVYCKLAKVSCGLDLLDLCERSGHPILRTIVGSVCCLTLALTASLIFRQYIESVQALSLVDTPIYIIGILFALGMILGAYAGLKSVAKVHSFFVPIIFLIVVILLIMVSPNFDFTALTPLLGAGPSSIFGTGFFTISTLFELLILFFLPPLLKSPEKFGKIGSLTIVFSLAYFLMITTAFLLSIPNPDALDNFLPIFQMVRLIELGTFFQRLESIFLIVFTISAFLYLSSMLFFLTHIFVKTFHITYEKPLFIPLGLLVASFSAVSFLSDKAIRVLNSSSMFLWVLPFVVPLLLLLLFRRKVK